MFVSGRGPRYSEREARTAVAASISYAEALRRLGMRPAGGNHRTLRRYVERVWRIPNGHFDPDRARNGVANDNRLENLRMLCPHCAATLDTHCGRQNRLERDPRNCLHCGDEFWPGYASQRYCSRSCGVRHKTDGRARPERRKVRRPPYTHLRREIRALGYAGTGRRYGVSDNAIRKWLRQYERERIRAKSKEEPRRLE